MDIQEAILIPNSRNCWRGRRVGARCPCQSPAALLRLGARIDKALRGANAKLTADRAAYICHPDWVSDPTRKPDPALWHPQVDTLTGVRDTVRWYAAQGLL